MVERDTESLTPTRIYSMTNQAAALNLFTLLYSWRLRQLFKIIHTLRTKHYVFGQEVALRRGPLVSFHKSYSHLNE